VSELDPYDYDLPPELVAVTPAERRDQSRLLCLDRATGSVSHRRFSQLPQLLRAGDLLVVNDARVIPARLSARRETGGVVEALLVRPHEGEDLTWLAMLRAGGTLREGEVLSLRGAPIRLRLLQKRDGGYWLLRLEGDGVALDDVLASGRMPLPPYILKARRERGMAEYDPQLDQERYQTVFAQRPGAVAAPTAGLHYTDRLLESIRDAGVQVRALSLMVGPGTFRPVKADRIADHVLEPESYHLPADTAAAVREALADGRRIVATGTTCCRVLEYVARCAQWEEHSGWTDLFVYPPFEFRSVSALITNFHLPRSTLLMLVCALAGREKALEAYRIAVEERYRFYSYGDAMFIH